MSPRTGFLFCLGKQDPDFSSVQFRTLRLLAGPKGQGSERGLETGYRDAQHPALDVILTTTVDCTAGLPVSYKLGPRLSVIVTRSNFKSETIFGFLGPDYTG